MLNVMASVKTIVLNQKERFKQQEECRYTKYCGINENNHIKHGRKKDACKDGPSITVLNFTASVKRIILNKEER
jgi:hypothetical protein